MPRRPKHRLVFETLRREIASGKYADHVLPSEAQLVRRFKMSRPTVARAMLDLQRLGLVDRRRGSGSYLRQDVAGLIGLLLSGLEGTEVIDPIEQAIVRSVEGAGRTPCVARRGKSVEESCRELIRRKVAGVFFAPIELPEDREQINLKAVALLRAAGVAVVLIDRDLYSFPKRSELDLVAVDDFGAGFELTSHLLAIGHRRFVFVARPQYPSTTDQRLAGCHEAIARFEIKDCSMHVLVGEPREKSFIRRIESAKAHAVICSNDQTAEAVMRGLGKQRVPREIAVVGFDDVKSSTLTTMRMPIEAIGDYAMRTMAGRIANADAPGCKVLLKSKLVVRESCGMSLPPRANRNT